MTAVPPPPPSYGGQPRPVPSNPLVSYWKIVILEHYADFTGRARRAQFWWYALANFIISVVFNVLGAATRFFTIVAVIYGLAVLIPGIAVAVRRLHDTDKSGWWLLLVLIPIVGAIVLIVFWATDGTPGPNKYGPSEKYA